MMTPRVDTRMNKTNPSQPFTEFRAFCGCGYPSSWVEERKNAVALVGLHRKAIHE